MTLMEAYRLTLRERVYAAKAVARISPTSEHLAEYGRAIMAHWATLPVLRRTWTPKAERG
jgi:hypothetical protein